MKSIVVSAVNLTQGGPLTILKECLEFLSNHLAGSYKIIALVNNADFFDDCPNVTFYSFPDSKNSWLSRLYYEYIYFLNFSKKLTPYLWLSLHDITPHVKADIRAVYCHNPSPFYKLSLKQAWLDPRFVLFNLFYKYLYLINIKKNDFIIVQQNVLRDVFREFAGKSQIIVAHPNISQGALGSCWGDASGGENIFFYPAFPRVFKNFEVIGKACEILTRQGVDHFEIILTISGSENRYARHIHNSFKHIKQIKFIGLQQRKKIFALYQKSCCVIFPSKLETWGIPITEAKLLGKPLLLADLKYAHETLGTYDKAKFFDVNSAQQLADAMKNIINKTIVFEKPQTNPIEPPFAQSWKELFDILLQGA